MQTVVGDPNTTQIIATHCDKRTLKTRTKSAALTGTAIFKATLVPRDGDLKMSMRESVCWPQWSEYSDLTAQVFGDLAFL